MKLTNSHRNRQLTAVDLADVSELFDEIFDGFFQLGRQTAVEDELAAGQRAQPAVRVVTGL